MQNAEALTGHQIEEFLTGSEGSGFTREAGRSIYAWTEQLLVAQQFMGRSRKRRDAIRRYARQVTGVEPATDDTVDPKLHADGSLELRVSLRCRFAGKYTERDVTLLAEVDRAQERLSGSISEAEIALGSDRLSNGELAWKRWIERLLR